MIYPRIWLPKYASYPYKLFSVFRLFCGAFLSVVTEIKAESNSDSDLSIMRQLAIHRVNSRKFSPPLSEWYSTKEKSIYRIDVEFKIIPCLMRLFYFSEIPLLLTWVYSAEPILPLPSTTSYHKSPAVTSQLVPRP